MTRLLNFDQIRPSILKDVVTTSLKDLTGQKKTHPDLLLGEALYQERLRIKREKFNIFTKNRVDGDKALWNEVQRGLVKSQVEVDRTQMIEKVLSHYAEEIGGHFDENVYKTATITVPLIFDWLLNAASLKRILPWKMQARVASRMRITGHVDHLKKLSEKGTILLVPTHQSNIDSVLIGYIIYLMGLQPFCYGAGLNLFSNPLLSYFMSRLGAYTVDRQKKNEIYKNILKNYSARILSEGIHSIFFPGGGRSRSGAIEGHLKLGLLGTTLEAQLENLKQGRPNPNVYIVPMVMSSHFVLEASSLIEDFLAESGKHRFIIMDDESWQATKVLKFFWQMFSAKSGMTIRVGKPLDIFGNLVDEEGQSLGPNGTIIDPVKWLTTCGELKGNPARDHEYTRLLGNKISERFHKENTVLTSQLVAFTFFEYLRKQYPDLDLYRFLRISLPQRSVDTKAFFAEAAVVHEWIVKKADSGEFFLQAELRTKNVEAWVRDGVKQLVQYHSTAPVKIQEGVIFSEDMNLLYYYRNRLAGYGLSLLSGQIDGAKEGYDRKGFLV